VLRGLAAVQATSRRRWERAGRPRAGTASGRTARLRLAAGDGQAACGNQQRRKNIYTRSNAAPRRRIPQHGSKCNRLVRARHRLGRIRTADRAKP